MSHHGFEMPKPTLASRPEEQRYAQRFDRKTGAIGLSRKIEISIVDDDESVREALVDLMNSHGYHAEAFESSEDFLDSERRGRTDCLIADIQLPGMTGVELHTRLRALDEPIPTILITARPDEPTRRRALSAGVQCYLIKPFDNAALLGCVNAAINDPGN